MQTRPKPTVGDLFSGAGLFSLAFQKAGGALRFAVELDRWAAASYARNVGDHVRIGSVENDPCTTRAEILIAGPPCQGFSTLGRRDPKDERNKLCLSIPRWAMACRAQVVVIENVPPFLESRAWRQLCSALRQQRFELTHWCLDAFDFGVPQRRRRSFTIASKIGLPLPPCPSRTRAIADEAFGRTRRNDPMHVWPENTFLATSRMKHLPALGDRRDILAAAPNLCPPSWHKIGCQATDVWGRMNPREPANTIRCDFQNPSKGRYIHPEEDRMISLREAARLQQIPGSWTLVGHRTAITRQIGNGVPVGLGKAVAASVMSLF